MRAFHHILLWIPHLRWLLLVLIHYRASLTCASPLLIILILLRHILIIERGYRRIGCLLKIKYLVSVAHNIVRLLILSVDRLTSTSLILPIILLCVLYARTTIRFPLNFVLVRRIHILLHIVFELI